ncbi:MAG: hypothetical protein JWN52_1889 [Actinomycetia bacterium]|nr:hypothetical protein [Actinomycetes bacterium]
MIDKVTRGTGVAKLIYYLYGPGKHNEHTDPHLVAGYRHPAVLEPDLRADGRRDFRPLIAVLNSPLETLRRRPVEESVWQCSLRTARGDRELSDEEWADIAEELMHQTQIAPRGDPHGCRWIAVRHADDHIHVVATLARDDGRNPNIRGDYHKARRACRIVEERYGLQVTAAADRTAAPRPTRAETEHARRKGWAEPPRTTLRRAVATAAAGARSQEEFFARLEEAGVLVRLRWGRAPVEVTGYSVALPGHTNRDGEPVWFAGRRLAPDLTMPKLQQRWNGSPPGQPTHEDDRYGIGRGRPRSIRGSTGAALTFAERDAVYQQTANAVGKAVQQMRWITDPRVGADLAAATSDALHVAGAVTGNRHLIAAADGFGRAAREPYGRQPALTRYGDALRAAVRILALTRIGRNGRPDPMVEVMSLIINLALLAEAIADFRESQQRHAQAAAARTAATGLRAAVRKPAPVPAPRVEQPAQQMHPAALAAMGFPTSLPDLLARPTPPPTGTTADRRPGHGSSPARATCPVRIDLPRDRHRDSG